MVPCNTSISPRLIGVTHLLLTFVSACGARANVSGGSAQPQAEDQPKANATLSTLPTGDVVTCPIETGSTAIDFSKIKLVRAPEVKNHFQNFGNIEGPVWIDGALYYSNIAGDENPPSSVIFRWVPGQTPEIVLSDSGSNGLAVDGSGHLLAAQHSDGTVSRLNQEVSILAQESERAGGTFTALIREHAGARFNSPNDLVVSKSGTLFFTDPTWQAPSPHPQVKPRAYKVMDGVAVPIGRASEPENPNGITLSHDERKLYIGGVNGLYRYERDGENVSAEGILVKTQHLSDKSGIDGLGRDCAGNLYVTSHAENLIVVLNANEEELSVLAVPGATGVTNVAFGGADGKTLFVTSLGAEPKIHSAKMPYVGYPY